MPIEYMFFTQQGEVLQRKQLYAYLKYASKLRETISMPIFEVLDCFKARRGVTEKTYTLCPYLKYMFSRGVAEKFGHTIVSLSKARCCYLFEVH